MELAEYIDIWGHQYPPGIRKQHGFINYETNEKILIPPSICKYIWKKKKKLKEVKENIYLVG